MRDDPRIQQALLHPASVFATPEEVAAAADIPQDLKIEILRRWEYDIREQEVAQEENMPGAPRMPLERVLRALLALGEEGEDRPAPTKQGGV